eukprot:165661-Prorocentrum_lima.AAC.1
MEAARTDPLPIHNWRQAWVGEPEFAGQHVASLCNRVQQEHIRGLLCEAGTSWTWNLLLAAG